MFGPLLQAALLTSLAASTALAADPPAPALYHEKLRPQFHFTPARNWTNDPNGLVFYRGEYHLFFQHNPTGVNWGNMTWGHAVSTDLVHWKQLPDAIKPDKLGTIFSGSAVVDSDNTAGFQKGDEKTIVAVYTAAGGTSDQSKGQPFTQCIAYSTDRGRTFTKFDGNPVLKHIVGGNRDPKVVWHAPTRRWIMALYLDGNEFAFFSSPDLKSWIELQRMKVPGCGECPDFFPVNVDGKADQQKWVWTAANGQYLIGAFNGKKFTRELGPLRVDFGANFYAVQTYSDIPASDGRRIQLAWMNGGKYPGMPFNQQMSFPCELKLRQFDEGLRLCRYPVREIEEIRGAQHKWTDVPIRRGEAPLPGTSHDLLDVQAEIDPGTATEVGLWINGHEISYAPASGRLSALGRSAIIEGTGNTLKLRILADRTSVEVFANDGRVSMTTCCLPDDNKRGVHVRAVGGAATLKSMIIHELQSIWE